MDTTAVTSSLLVPEGTRLVHIGPHKTGTTSLQGAFHAARAAVSAQGVHYAGATRQPLRAVHAVLGQPWHLGDGRPAPIRDWRALVREIDGAREPRVVVSSEGFAEAEPDAIRRVVADLGGERVHVVVTLRPLARILASQWQQYVQSGITRSFEAWLEAVFNQSPGTVTPTFWVRHRHDSLVARWAGVVGPDRLTVVVVDERDHAMVLRVFEQLVGLRAGTLAAEDDRSNRSMTLPEIEAIRAFNVAFKAEGLGGPLHSQVMRLGAGAYMKLREPAATWPRLEAPQWALDRAGEIAREMVPAIAASGARIIGDLGSLTAVPTSGLAGETAEVCIPPEVAASMAMGVLFSSGLARDGGSVRPGSGDRKAAGGRKAAGARKAAGGRRAGAGSAWFEPPELFRVPTVVLGFVMLGRVRAAARRRIRGLLRRSH